LDLGAKAMKTAEGGPPAALGERAWLGLVLLTVIFSINSMDRSAMTVLVEPIKHEFHLKDSQMGLLTGLAYGASYALFAIPLGALADRVNRRNLLAGLLAIWSAATVACGLAGSYAMLLVARMVVGAAESGGSPSSNSMISDLFPPHRRATAVAIFFTATAIGSGLAFLVGSAVAQAHGWRATFLLAGVPGLVMAAVLLLVMRHPARGGTDDVGAGAGTAEAGSMLGGLRSLFADPVLICIFFGWMLGAGVPTVVQAWFPSILIREHGLSLKQAGVALALGSGLFAALGVGLSGRAADAFARGRSGRLMLFSAGTLTTALVCGVVAVTTRSTPLAIAALCGFGLFNLAHVGPMMAVLLNTVPNRDRGVLVASLQVGANLFGTGMGPWIAGMLSDAYTGPHALSLAVLTVLPAELVAVALCVIAWRVLSRRMARGVAASGI
jgi:predicted MFS family arabinose efflux permease